MFVWNTSTIKLLLPPHPLIWIVSFKGSLLKYSIVNKYFWPQRILSGQIQLWFLLQFLKLPLWTSTFLSLAILGWTNFRLFSIYIKSLPRKCFLPEICTTETDFASSCCSFISFCLFVVFQFEAKLTMATFALCPQLDRKLDQNLAPTAIAATSQVQKENKQKLGQNLTDRPPQLELQNQNKGWQLWGEGHYHFKSTGQSFCGLNTEQPVNKTQMRALTGWKKFVQIQKGEINIKNNFMGSKEFCV